MFFDSTRLHHNENLFLDKLTINNGNAQIIQNSHNAQIYYNFKTKWVLLKRYWWNNTSKFKFCTAVLTICSCYIKGKAVDSILSSSILYSSGEFTKQSMEKYFILRLGLYSF